MATIRFHIHYVIDYIGAAGSETKQNECQRAVCKGLSIYAGIK
jgi:hypothetical protein